MPDLEFDDVYGFGADDKIVCIKGHDDTYLGMDNDKKNEIDNKGNKGQDEGSQWKIDKIGDNKCKIKSVETGKYVRLQNKKDIDVEGDGNDEDCIWIVHEVEKKDGRFKLESADKKGQYLCIKNNGKVKPGEGGDKCIFTFYKGKKDKDKKGNKKMKKLNKKMKKLKM